MGKLYAIADLHLGYPDNLAAWRRLSPHPGDSLIIAGDVGETEKHLRNAFSIASERFDKVWWVPGNHELYSMPAASGDELSIDGRRGVAKYRACVNIAHEYDVRTPEDEYEVWEGEGGPAVVCPIFTLYDYSFRPEHISREKALDWALEENIQATDEALLHPDPYDSREAWCEAQLATTEARLEKAKAKGMPLIIINHWPLREDLIYIPRVPRFTLWCGSKKTQDWHTKFGASVVVTGHLHVRRTDWKDETRFEEVSLGYPRQWEGAREHGNGVDEMLRLILPEPKRPSTYPQTQWRRYG
jgi:predicted phosphodiesterase